MKLFPRARTLAAALLAAPLLASAFPARQTKTQQPAPPARAGAARAKAEARQRAEAADPAEVTLDELFAADSYAVYGELRMVGQHVASEDFRQLLEPLKLAGIAQPDVLEMYEFVAARAEQLAGARVAFGGMPVKPGLPSIVAAVELPSGEEARRFAPQLREFLAKSGAWGAGGEAAMSEAVAPADATDAGRRGGRRRRGQARGGAANNTAATRKVAAAKEAAPPFHIRQAGAVVALSDAPFTFRKLRGPAEAPPLSREPGFAAARSRLATESLFLYFNTTRMGAATRRQMEDAEREHRRMAEEQERRERDEARRNAGSSANSNAGGPTLRRTATAGGNRNLAAGEAVEPAPDMDPEWAEAMRKAEEDMRAQEEALKKQTPEEQAARREAERQREFQSQLGNLIFSGGPAGGAWPESIGVGAGFEGDSVVVRAFLVGEAEDKPPRLVPFVPLLHAGPQIAAEAVNVLPDDTDMVVSASLDLAQMYDYVASMFRIFDLAAGAAGQTDKQGLFDSQVGAFEKQLKFRIREDLISALGNEMAVAIPPEAFGVRRRGNVSAGARDKEPGGAAWAGDGGVVAAPDGPVVVVALKDKRAVQSLLPRALGAMGVTGVGAEQLLQKQGEAELVTFAGGGVAFIDNFLVVAFDARAMKRVVDAYNEGRTLGRSRRYRDPADWQPRQVLGQAYVSSALLREVFGDAHKSIDDIDDEDLRAYLAKLDPEPGAITLAATRDATGLTHELRVPKNLLNLWAASSLVGQKLAPMRSNEAHATATLYSIFEQQGEHKKQAGRYAPLEELRGQLEQQYEKQGIPKGAITAPLFTVDGYDIKVTASGDTFEATATPNGYPKQGRRSFYIDQTGQLRGGDHGGRPASASSEPVSY